MNMLMQRFTAAFMLMIPGLAATYGFLSMKNAFFHLFEPGGGFQWFRFGLGLLLFAAGAGFIGGWTYFRDRKRGYAVVGLRTGRRGRPQE